MTNTPDETLVSEFPSVRSKKSREITSKEYVDTVRSDRYREAVQRYRELKSQPGNEAEAQKVKDGMPCIIPAGVCRDGHAVKNLVTHSGLVCIDLDHTDTRTQEIFELTRTLPYVHVSHISISGEGVKLMVRIRPKDLDDYPRLYTAIGEDVSRHVQHPYDSKCKILTQPCFYSWHPQAYYNPDALPFEMPRDRRQADGNLSVAEQEAAQRTVTQETTVQGTAAQGTTVPPQAEANAETSVAKPTTAATPAPGFLAQFLDDFEHRNPFRRGERNDLALKLGRSARSKGFSQKELEEITLLFARHYAASDFTTDDIRQRITAGYQFIAEQKAEKQNSVQVPSRVQVPLALPESEKDKDDEEEVLENNNVLRASAPYIPEAVYEHLPQLLQDCVKYAANRRERDFMLLGSLNSCSAALPHVRFLYNRHYYSPHFYLATVASAGAGKGVIGNTATLLTPIQHYYEGLYAQQKKDYEKEVIGWEMKMDKMKHGKNPEAINLDDKPEAPTPHYLAIPASTSKSRLVEHLAQSEDIGCSISTTEINTLITALGQDYGRFDDILCKAAHHELIEQSYKNEGEPVKVECPRLALNISGTQEQFNALFRSHENGLLSRFGICTRQSDPVWQSCAPQFDGIDLGSHFNKLGKVLLEMHKTLLESPTLVSFTTEQWARHTEQFSAWLQASVIEGREAEHAIIYRHGLLAMRLSSIFTIFRKYDDYPYAKEYYCTDEDLESALLIIGMLIEHSLLMSTALPATTFKPRAMHAVHRLAIVLGRLKRKFTFTEFINACGEEGISKSAAKRLLKKSVETQVLVKQKDGYKKKKKTPPTKG